MLLVRVGLRVTLGRPNEGGELQAVNGRAVFLVLREAARRISDGGRIINISSSTTAYPQAGYAM